MADPNVNELLLRKIAETGPGGARDPNYKAGFNITAKPTLKPPNLNQPSDMVTADPTQASMDFISDWRDNQYHTQFTNGKPNGVQILGPDGTALPKGAQVWDWFGNPYYGEGFGGWFNKLSSKLWQGNTSQLSTNQLEQIATLSGANSENRYAPKTPEQQAELNKLLKAGGYVTSATPGWWENVYGMARANFDRFWNVGTTPQGDATLGTALARMPGVTAEALTDTAQAGLEFVEKNLTGLMNVGAAVQLNQIHDFNDAARVYGTGFQEGGTFATQVVDYATNLAQGNGWKSAVAQEFARRYAAGENPDLIAAELQNPLAEGVADLAIGIAPFGLGGFLDPLNWLGQLNKWRAAKQTLSELGDIAELSPEMKNIVEGISKIPNEARTGKALGQFADQVIQATKAGAGRIDDIAKEVDFFGATATAKRFQAAKRQGAILNMIAKDAGNTQNAIDAVEGLWKIGRGAAIDDVQLAKTLTAEGLSQLSSVLPYIDPVLGSAGSETAATLYKVLGDDPARFLEGVRTAAKEGTVNLIEKIGKTLEAGEAKVFPTLTERIKAGEKFSPFVVALDKFHQLAQKTVVGKTNSAFAQIYMGANPGFAFRNLFTNLLHVGVDQGPMAIFNKDWWQGKLLKDVFGYTPGVYEADKTIRGSLDAIEAAKESGGLIGFWKKHNMLALSNVFEKWSAQMVATQSVKNTFKIALKEGVAIPSTVALIEAGIPKETALSMVKLLVKHFGDVDAAMTEFRAAQKAGYIGLLQTLGHIAPEDLSALNQLPGDIQGQLKTLYETAQAEHWTPSRLEAETDLLKQKILDIGNVDTPMGAAAADELGNPTVAAEISADMAETARSAGEEKAINSLIESHVTAGENLRTNQQWLAKNLLDQIKNNTTRPDLVQAVSQMADGIPQQTVRQQWRTLQGMVHQISELSKSRKEFISSGEMQKAWTLMGREGAAPSEIAEFRRILWEEYYYPKARTLFENLADAQQKVLNEALSLVDVNQTNLQQAIKQVTDSYALDQAWRQVAGDWTAWRSYNGALLRQDFATANRILANRFRNFMKIGEGNVAITSDSGILSLINSNLPEGAQPFASLADVRPNEDALPAFSRWLRKTAQAESGTVTAAPEVAQVVPQANEALNAARQHRAVDQQKLNKAIDQLYFSGRTNDLPTDMQQGLQATFGNMLNDLSSGAPGGVTRIESTAELPEQYVNYGSSYADWYGQSGVYKMSYKGQKGKAGVVKALNDLINGSVPANKADKQMISTLLDEATKQMWNGSNFDIPNNPVGSVLIDILNQLPSATAEDIANFTDQLNELQTNADTLLIGYSDLTKSMMQTHIDNVMEAVLTHDVNAPAASTSTFVGSGRAAQDFMAEVQRAFRLAPDEAQAVAQLNDARANTWAAITDRPVEEWYSLRLKAVRQGGEDLAAGAQRIKRNSKLLGAVGFEDGRAIIDGFKSADASTALNSLARVYRRDLYSTLGEITNESERVLLTADIQTLEKYFGVKEGTWTTAQENKFAGAFERYLRDGQTEAPSLKRIFEQFRNWLKRIYTSIVGTKLDQDIPAEVKQVFDNMLIEGPRPLAPLPEGATILPNYQIRQAADPITTLFERIKNNATQRFSEIIPLEGGTQQSAAAIKAWETEAKARMSQLRLFAAKRAQADRAFTLLDYPDKKGIDLAMAYVFPYQFWYSRTFKNWMQRIVSNPSILANYARYRETLGKIHAGAPDWWKYNLNSNELTGQQSDSPLFFNLEQTLNPLNGITGVDFTSPYAKLTWYTNMIDQLGKFGPNVWTPFNWAVALALANEAGKGQVIDPETGLPTDFASAARYYAGKLFPQSTSIKNMLTLAGVEGKWLGQSGINELDPISLAFQGGMDYFERRRAGRAAAQVQSEGQYSPAQILQDFQQQSGPAWDAAVKTAILNRAGSWTQTLLPFLFGVGFKARNASDIQIDRFDQEYRAVWANAANLSPDELRDQLTALKEKYPWSDTVILSRKTGLERDRSYAYNVLSRIPPGSSSRVWEAVGLNADVADKFYSNKGNLALMSEGDRKDFMLAVVALGAVLDLPPDTTRRQWDSAKTAYSAMQQHTKEQFGANILDEINFYFTLTTPEEKQAFMEANPQVGQALDYQAQEKQTNPNLRDYYGSFESIERYYNGLMFDALRTRFGDLSALWQQYNDEALKGNSYKQAFWKANPVLQAYVDAKTQYEVAITQAIQNAGEKLNTVPLILRPDVQPASVKEQNVVNLATTQPTQTVYEYDWGQLQALMSPALARLVEDHFLRGEDLPYAATSQLDKVAAKYNITSDQFLLLVQKALQAVANGK